MRSHKVFHPKQPWSIFATIALFLTWSNIVKAQAINPDTINFGTIAVWNDMRGCLQLCFDYYSGIQRNVGCSTNACLCRPDVLGQALVAVSSRASDSCHDIQDISSASSILTAYCAAKGYTSIIAPTVLASGSCTAASTITVTAYVTQITTVRSTSAPRATVPLVQDLRLVWILVALSVVLLQVPQQQPQVTTTSASSTSTISLPTSQPDPAPTVLSTPSNTATMSVTGAVSSTSANTFQSPSPASTAGPSGSTFTTPEIVGTVVGIVGALATIIALIIKFKS